MNGGAVKVSPRFGVVKHGNDYRIGVLYIAKSVFQMDGGDAEGQVVMRRQLERRDALVFLQKLPPGLVGIVSLRFVAPLVTRAHGAWSCHQPT